MKRSCGHSHMLIWSFTFIFSVHYCNVRLFRDTQQGGPPCFIDIIVIQNINKHENVKIPCWHQMSVFHCWCVFSKNMALMLKANSPPPHRPQLCQCSTAPPRTAKRTNGIYLQVWLPLCFDTHHPFLLQIFLIQSICV